MRAVGVNDSLGPGTTPRLRIGQPVVAFVLPAGQHGGAYAERVVVPEASVVAAPRRVDPFAASTLLLNAVTARLALDALALSSGDTLSVTGSAGVLGGYVIQLAQAAGSRVVAEAAAADKDLVTTLGADHVVQRGPDFAARVIDIVPGGATGLVDAASQDGAALAAVADRGAMATVRGWNGPSERGITIHPIVSTTAARDTGLLSALVDLVDDGTLTLRVAGVLAPSEARDAHRRMERGGLRGRLVLDFHN